MSAVDRDDDGLGLDGLDMACGVIFGMLAGLAFWAGVVVLCALIAGLA